MPAQNISSRRQFLKRLGLGAAATTVPGLFADELARTPRQTEGPFYPDNLPLDTDNDLILINDSLTSSVGTITHLTGRVLDSRGDPIRNAMVEIWQVDHNGVYLHTASPNRDGRDGNFQGFGRFLTGSKGEYYFRTIKPVAYSDRAIRRTPHIHYAVSAPGRDRLTTQLYIRGERRNERDRILQGIRDPKARESLIVEFTPIPDSRIGELAAHFEIVLGVTPQD